MDFTWIAVAHSATAWLALVFALGLLVRQIGLPPLVGFLIAGFVMKHLGVEMTPTLHTLADLGITLLLFTIGLKLDLRSLTKPYVWGVASIHIALVVCVFGALIFAVSLLGIGLFSDIGWGNAALLGFALSFSSTVFAVKVLEEKGEMAANHGRIAIGILIMQDIIAVIFLTVSTGKVPSPWAILVLLSMFALRPLLGHLMKRVGHGELLVVYGFILAIGGAAIFEMVHMKADLGALVMGMVLARHERASEIANALLNIKDLLLIGFFLSIGLNASISMEVIAVALLVVALIPVKVALYFWLLVLFRLRARTSFLASVSLANYSEFGLIVGAVGLSNGWLTGEWLGVIAVALGATFVLASPLNIASHNIYARIDSLLKRFESKHCLAGEQPIDTGDATILVFGMGRVGTSAYNTMHQRFGDVVLGLDHDAGVVAAHQEAGRNVIQGDATDREFWEKLQPGKVNVVLLDMPNQSENLFAIQQLAKSGFKGKVAATVKYDDQIEELINAGVDAAYNIYGEAGSGFADHVSDQLCRDIHQLQAS
ncbi:MAG: cation:proton antiporter [Gammaproteobacteria bacterium]